MTQPSHFRFFSELYHSHGKRESRKAGKPDNGKGGKHMACPYYREPAAGEVIGCCNGDLTEIPSETHQNSLCRSSSGIYAEFCPIYARYQREKLCIHKHGILRRIFLNGYRKLVYNDKLEV
jgi:hypothetical protein